jgi:hypothetical protein
MALYAIDSLLHPCTDNMKSPTNAVAGVLELGTTEGWVYNTVRTENMKSPTNAVAGVLELGATEGWVYKTVRLQAMTYCSVSLEYWFNYFTVALPYMLLANCTKFPLDLLVAIVEVQSLFVRILKMKQNTKLVLMLSTI